MIHSVKLNGFSVYDYIWQHLLKMLSGSGFDKSVVIQARIIIHIYMCRPDSLIRVYDSLFFRDRQYIKRKAYVSGPIGLSLLLLNKYYRI